MDELQEVQITPKYILDEVEVTARRLDSNPSLSDPGRTLARDQEHKVNSYRETGGAPDQCPDPCSAQSVRLRGIVGVSLDTGRAASSQRRSTEAEDDRTYAELHSFRGHARATAGRHQR